MDVILGIDIGGSSTKIVGLTGDGTLLPGLRVRADDQRTSLFGAFGHYLEDRGLSLPDVRRVALTGVGAGALEGDVFGLPTCRVDEFSAIGRGALHLSGAPSALVVSMGTGTAFLWADGEKVEHLCGSGVGGGTLDGLCRRLAGTGRPSQIGRLAARGDPGRVDLLIRDIAPDPDAALDPQLTASNFGRLDGDASPADLAAGAARLVLQTIGTMTVLACRCCGTRTVVLTGSLTALPQTAENFRDFERIYGPRYIVPEGAGHATAIGAALCAMDRDRET